MRLFAEGNVDFALADLTQAEYDGYYLGYANRALWPVFHYRVDLAHFDEAEFAAYEQVNRRFARLLAQFTRDDDTVWVHDYHFLLMGQEMRAVGLGRAAWASSCTSPSRRRRSSPRCPSTSASRAGSAPSTSSASRPSATLPTSAAISLRSQAPNRSSRTAGIQVFDRTLARRDLLDRHRSRRHRGPRRRRGGPRRRRAPRPDHRQPRAGDRRRPDGLFQGPAAAHGGLRPHARRPRGAARPGQLPADRPALARGGRRLPGAARGTRPPRRPHQRRLCRPRLDADPLSRPQLFARRALRALPAGARRAGHAALRRHEPRRQGVRRRPGRRRIPARWSCPSSPAPPSSCRRRCSSTRTTSPPPPTRSTARSRCRSRSAASAGRS